MSEKVWKSFTGHEFVPLPPDCTSFEHNYGKSETRKFNTFTGWKYSLLPEEQVQQRVAQGELDNHFNLYMSVLGNNNDYFDYFFAVDNFCLCFPDQKCGILVGLINFMEGAGKTLACTLLGEAYGKYMTQLKSLKEFMSDFNKAEYDYLFIIVNEMANYNTKDFMADQEMLKTKLTEVMGLMHAKYRDRELAYSYFRILLTTNSSFPMAISHTNRRLWLTEGVRQYIPEDRLAPLYDSMDPKKAKPGTTAHELARLFFSWRFYFKPRNEKNIGKWSSRLKLERFPETEIMEKARSVTQCLEFKFIEAIRNAEIKGLRDNTGHYTDLFVRTETPYNFKNYGNVPDFSQTDEGGFIFKPGLKLKSQQLVQAYKQYLEKNKKEDKLKSFDEHRFLDKILQIIPKKGDLYHICDAKFHKGTNNFARFIEYANENGLPNGDKPSIYLTHGNYVSFKFIKQEYNAYKALHEIKEIELSDKQLANIIKGWAFKKTKTHPMYCFD
eukprot:Pgem_evm3s19338